MTRLRWVLLVAAVGGTAAGREPAQLQTLEPNTLTPQVLSATARAYLKDDYPKQKPEDYARLKGLVDLSTATVEYAPGKVTWKVKAVGGPLSADAEKAVRKDFRDITEYVLKEAGPVDDGTEAGKNLLKGKQRLLSNADAVKVADAAVVEFLPADDKKDPTPGPAVADGCGCGGVAVSVGGCHTGCGKKPGLFARLFRHSGGCRGGAVVVYRPAPAPCASAPLPAPCGGCDAPAGSHAQAAAPTEAVAVLPPLTPVPAPLPAEPTLVVVRPTPAPAGPPVVIPVAPAVVVQAVAVNTKPTAAQVQAAGEGRTAVELLDAGLRDLWKGRYGPALTQFEASLAKDAADPLAWYGKALAERAGGDDEAAEAARRRAVELRGGRTLAGYDFLLQRVTGAESAWLQGGR